MGEVVNSFYRYVRTQSGENGSRLFRRKLTTLAATGSFGNYSRSKLGRSDRKMLSLLQMFGETMEDGVTRQQVLYQGEMLRVRRLLNVSEDAGLAWHPHRFVMARKRFGSDHAECEFVSHRFPIRVIFHTFRMTGGLDEAPQPEVLIPAIEVVRTFSPGQLRVPESSRISGRLAA